MRKIKFEILIDECFLKNQNLLSMINDFENGTWRFEKFNNFIWDNISETALSAEERKALIDSPSTLLNKAAKNLRLSSKRDSIGEGSELAEIILYGIMKHHYKALPVVPKIFFKQNVQDNAKGADSVHIVITDDDFTLWLGEAKFYNNLNNNRLNDIIASVTNLLDKDKLKKENSIITNKRDIDSLIEDNSLREKIKVNLSNDISIDNIKNKLNIPILLLHECQITKFQTELSLDYKKQIIKYHRDRANTFLNRLNKKLELIHLHEKIKFHIIIFPVPDKNRIVKTFTKKIAFWKEEI